MYMVSKQIKIVIITLGMGLFMIVQANAGTSDGILSDWQGRFISRAFVNAMPQMDAVYKKMVVEAKKRGKTFTVKQVKTLLKKMGQTTFHTLLISGDDITFYDNENNSVTHRYKSLGKVPDSYGDYKFEWYAFEAVGKGVEDLGYRYVIMLKPHQHRNGQPHFHIRYGSKGIEALTGESGMENWWPTMVDPDFDATAYISTVNPKIMVKVLPGCNTK